MNSLSIKACTAGGLAAKCGTLTVPQDRLTGKGRTIAVRFVVIPRAGPAAALRTRWSISPAAPAARR